MTHLSTPDLRGVLLAEVLVCLVLTPALSGAVLWWYRRAVARSMTDRAVEASDHNPAPVAGPGAVDRPSTLASRSRIVELHVGDSVLSSVRASAPWQRARRRMRAAAWVYVAAGSVYGLVTSIVWLHVPLRPQGLVVLTVLHAWPLVPTLLAVLAAGRRAQVLTWTGYLVLVLLLPIGIPVSLAEVVELVVRVILPPAVTLVALSARSLRAVGPFLAGPVLLGSAPLVFWSAGWLTVAGLPAWVSLVVVVAGAAVLAVLGLGHLWWSARAYTCKRASDQTLLISQWWFLAAAWESISLGGDLRISDALLVWSAYVAFRLIQAAGLRLLQPPDRVPLRLLLLRTFGRRRRSESLLRRLGAHWRYLGPVRMIAGTDMAAAALEPHEFLDVLRGRLNRRFIGDADHLRRRLDELDERPDPDGRYRVEDLFCRENMWRAALVELIGRCDCFLVDARGLTTGHQGVAYEITQLVQLVPLRLVLVLTDGLTDRAFLTAVVDEAWRSRPASPTRDTGDELRILPAHTRVGPDPEVVTGLLAMTGTGAISRTTDDG